MSYLLDTNILIYAQKRQGHCLQHIDSHPASDLFISALTVQELAYGAAKSQRPEAALAYLSYLQRLYAVLPCDAASAHQAGRLRAQLESTGRPIGPYDLLIAGTALAHGLTLVTHNQREFARVPGLRLADWYAPNP